MRARRRRDAGMARSSARHSRSSASAATGAAADEAACAAGCGRQSRPGRVAARGRGGFVHRALMPHSWARAAAQRDALRFGIFRRGRQPAVGGQPFQMHAGGERDRDQMRHAGHGAARVLPPGCTAGLHIAPRAPAIRAARRSSVAASALLRHSQCPPDTRRIQGKATPTDLAGLGTRTAACSGVRIGRAHRRTAIGRRTKAVHAGPRVGVAGGRRSG